MENFLNYYIREGNYMENSNFKKEYKLKQHTMLLHFQAKPSSGDNVRLRASEVKPKLDRFILKKLGEIKNG